jgi:muramidase (phage lysozyme)
MRKLCLTLAVTLFTSCAQQGETAVDSTELSAAPTSSATSPRIKGSVLYFTDESPSILAMLDAIAYSEFRGNPEATNEIAYRTMVGYQRFSSYTKHPDIHRGESDSRASGRYQFKTATWIMLNRYISNGSASNLTWLKGPIRDFSPASQDKMAIVAMHQRQKYKQIKGIKYGDSAALRSVLTELSYEWASLPGNRYGQGGHDFQEFQRFYWQRYRFYHGITLASR